MTTATVFYAGQMYFQCFPEDLTRRLIEINTDVYSGCYIHCPNTSVNSEWYRGDQSPVLLQEVPKDLLLLKLLLNL